MRSISGYAVFVLMVSLELGCLVDDQGETRPQNSGDVDLSQSSDLAPASDLGLVTQDGIEAPQDVPSFDLVNNPDLGRTDIEPLLDGGPQALDAPQDIPEQALPDLPPGRSLSLRAWPTDTGNAELFAYLIVETSWGELPQGCVWLVDGVIVQEGSCEPFLHYGYWEPGDYTITVEALDELGNRYTTSQELHSLQADHNSMPGEGCTGHESCADGNACSLLLYPRVCLNTRTYEGAVEYIWCDGDLCGFNQVFVGNEIACDPFVEDSCGEGMKCGLAPWGLDCVPEGFRQENGEPCNGLAGVTYDTCGEGMVCIQERTGILETTRCSRLCLLEGPKVCDPGEQCWDAWGSSFILPDGVLGACGVTTYPGDDCEHAIPIDSSGTYELDIACYSHDTVPLPCLSSGGGSGADAYWELSLDVPSDVRLDIEGSDADVDLYLSVRANQCGERVVDIGCCGSTQSFDNLEPGLYHIVVDSCQSYVYHWWDMHVVLNVEIAPR